MMRFFIALIAVIQAILNSKTSMRTTIIAAGTVASTPSLGAAVTLLAASIQTIRPALQFVIGCIMRAALAPR